VSCRDGNKRLGYSYHAEKADRHWHWPYVDSRCLRHL
jgi:hypothetical protein